MSSTRKKLLFIPALLVGVAALVLAVKGKSVPEKAPPKEKVTRVRVIEAASMPVVPRAIAYGIVQPGTVWNAVAEAAGEIVETNPQLKKGAILAEGDVLFRIDPTPYELAAAQIEANIRATEAELAELEVRETNTRSSLAIEERSLVLSRKDLQRQKELKKKKAVAQAAVDKEERNVLARQLSVQTQRNTLNLIPAQRESLEAQLAVDRARLEDARLDLERTTIRAPFDCRVAEVRAEAGQFAASNATLAVVDSIAVSEVSAQLPIDKMMSIMSPSDTPFPALDTVMSELPAIIGIAPTVRLRTGERVIEWQARMARISDTIDPQTRTVGVIVAVDDPYRQTRPGYRPPLVKNMFVEVELQGRPRDGLVVVPRAALSGDTIHVVGPEDRLVKRTVEPLFRQTNFVALKGGIEPGERVIVTDLVPAIEGMLLAPQRDEEAEARLSAEARGEGPVR